MPRTSADRIRIYTDGGADPNPGTGGWGVVIIRADGSTDERSGWAPSTTNNRMELQAAIEALAALPVGASIELSTDSRYVRQGMTAWVAGWVRRGWQRKSGEPILNLDLWQRLYELDQERDVRWRWVKGHAGDPLNERADALATVEIRRHRPETTADEVVVADWEIVQRVRCVDGRGAWAALVRGAGAEELRSGTLSDASANRLELSAACALLEALPADASAAVYSTSDYLRNGASNWIEGWRQRGWKTQAGESVKNADLWQRLDRLQREHDVSWPAAKGRMGDELRALVPVLRRTLARG